METALVLLLKKMHTSQSNKFNELIFLLFCNWVPHGPSPDPEVKSRLSSSPSSRRRFPRVRTQTRLLPPPIPAEEA